LPHSSIRRGKWSKKESGNGSFEERRSLAKEMWVEAGV
jgi:hypothetical protein